MFEKFCPKIFCFRHLLATRTGLVQIYQNCIRHFLFITICYLGSKQTQWNWWLIDWLVHLHPPITRKRRCAMLWTNPHPLRSWPFSKLSCWHFDFFPRKFATCSKPPSRDNYRKASYPRTQQRDQGAGWTHDSAIRVVVKTTPLPIRPRCRQTTNVHSSTKDGLWV